MPATTTTTISSLSSATLSNLCNFCGLPKNGTKAVLRLRLQQAAQSYRPINNTPKILSIDLGLKNFAFSVVSPSHQAPPPPAIPGSSTLALISRVNFFNNRTPILPHISLQAWNRLDLTQNLSPSFSFSPAEMATLTINLVITHLLPLNPTHILIELQRFRSGSAASIQEWTVRVNTLEAMLHAVFKLLSTSSSSTPVLEVSSVAPKLVAGYLYPSTEDQPLKPNGQKLQAYYILKKNKVNMLGKWLDEDKLIVAGNKEMQAVIERFVEAWRAKGERKKKGEEVKEMIGKLDDLSDSVLQAMVWLQWNRNLKRVIDEFPELLEEINEEDAATVAAKKPVKKKGRKTKADEYVDELVKVQGEEEGEKKKKSSTRKKKDEGLMEEDMIVVFKDLVVEAPAKRSRKKDLDVESEVEAVLKKPNKRKKKDASSTEEKLEVVLEDDSVKPPKRSRKKKTVDVEAEPEPFLEKELLEPTEEEQSDITVEDSPAVKTATKRSSKKKTLTTAVEPELSLQQTTVKIPTKRSRKKKSGPIQDINPNQGG
ncbi:mitochondrial resolvase Ydc2 [Podospora fimiseda]|uniref:Mitochondrial resolvase Ydc2 n=1 Tax=Podospora fimiseda TaxID=252190 RepID=A0AAN7H158_9PEZI|nr:mitochondrial resolvase Ydc2 [Podospora fimiseda]